jgi:small subunit ribosomal protein S6
MATYELPIVLKTSDTESSKETVKSILQKHSATIESEDPWGTRKLAYEIDQEQEGFYLILTIEVAPDAIKKIINDFRLNSDVLRYFFIKIKKV